MAEVKWIKLTTNMFDNSKIKYIRTLPEGNNIVLIWVMLLTKAGQCNSNGYIFITENIPYTKEALASEFGFDINVITLALEMLARLDMIRLKEEKIFIEGWSEHQNTEGLDKIREQTRKRVEKYRQKQLKDNSNVTCNATVTENNATVTHLDIEEDKDIDKDIDINNSISKDILVPLKLEPIVKKWNSLGLQEIKTINAGTNRHKLLNARIKDYGIDKVLETIESVNRSSFLKGQNNRGWVITFDWLIKPNNFVKVMEGNYIDKVAEQQTEGDEPF